MKRIRVLVIDDSAFMRKIISDILESDQRIEVIGTARNGEDGIKKIRLYSPDVVTMDVQMPVMDGISALETIMETNPVPVIVLSASSKEGASKTMEAMEKGAVDFIQKPSGPISLDMDMIKQQMITKVVTAATINLEMKQEIKHNPILKTNWHKQSSQNYNRNNEMAPSTILAIGASTGGPRALQKIISRLPASFPAPIFIVQHMPEGFTKSLADRLNKLCKIVVKEAEDGEIANENTAYIAPGNQHMRIVEKGANGLSIKLSKDSPKNNHRPSVDILFESVSQLSDRKKIAVILTGMGKDGSLGLASMKQMDHSTITIVESEETAIVYGMPKAAVETGYVDFIELGQDIGAKLIDLLGVGKR